MLRVKIHAHSNTGTYLARDNDGSWYAFDLKEQASIPLGAVLQLESAQVDTETMAEDELTHRRYRIAMVMVRASKFMAMRVVEVRNGATKVFVG